MVMLTKKEFKEICKTSIEMRKLMYRYSKPVKDKLGVIRRYEIDKPDDDFLEKLMYYTDVNSDCFDRIRRIVQRIIDSKIQLGFWKKDESDFMKLFERKLREEEDKQ